MLQLPRNMFAAAPVDSDLPSIRARIEIPTRTIVKVVLAILAVYLAVRLSSVLLDIFIAVLFTAALDPIVTRLETRGWKRSTAVAVLIVIMLIVTAGFLLLTVPPMVREGTSWRPTYPRISTARNPSFAITRKSTTNSEVHADPGQATRVSMSPRPRRSVSASRRFHRGALVVTMTAYLLISDGERSLFRLVGFFAAAQRAKVRRAMPEISKVVSEYVVGQSSPR